MTNNDMVLSYINNNKFVTKERIATRFFTLTTDEIDTIVAELEANGKIRVARTLKGDTVIVGVRKPLLF